MAKRIFQEHTFARSAPLKKTGSQGDGAQRSCIKGLNVRYAYTAVRSLRQSGDQALEAVAAGFLARLGSPCMRSASHRSRREV